MSTLTYDDDGGLARSFGWEPPNPEPSFRPGDVVIEWWSSRPYVVWETEVDHLGLLRVRDFGKQSIGCWRRIKPHNLLPTNFIALELESRR